MIHGTFKMNKSMSRIGYARTSTTDQNLEAKILALEAAGCQLIRSEQRSGTLTLVIQPDTQAIFRVRSVS